MLPGLLAPRGLADITGDTRSLFLSAPADDAGDLLSRSEGALIESDWFIRASCQASWRALGTGMVGSLMGMNTQ